MTNQLLFPATLGRLPGIQWSELIMKSSSFRNNKLTNNEIIILLTSVISNPPKCFIYVQQLITPKVKHFFLRNKI